MEGSFLYREERALMVVTVFAPTRNNSAHVSYWRVPVHGYINRTTPTRRHLPSLSPARVPIYITLRMHHSIFPLADVTSSSHRWAHSCWAAPISPFVGSTPYSLPLTSLHLLPRWRHFIFPIGHVAVADTSSRTFPRRDRR